MSLAVVLIIVTICLLVSGFFSGSEMALVNADRYRIAAMVERGSRRARATMALLNQPAIFFATTLVGTNIALVTASVVTTLFIIQRWGAEYAAFAMLLAPISLIIAEIAPKSIFHHHADRIALQVTPILRVTEIVFYPLVLLLSKITESFFKRMRSSTPHEGLSREEIELMLEVGEPAASDVRPAERTLVSRIFDLAEKRVENIMTPLVDVVGVPITATRDEAAKVLAEYEFSRVPVYETRLYNIIGVLTNTDLLFGPPDAQLRNIVHKPYYVPEEMPLDELFVAMKRRSEPMAIAVDEYGAATGIVTAEDLIEEVVGEIQDEHDVEPPLYKRLAKNRYLVNGRLEIETANERLKFGIPEGEYETIAGFIIHRLERIPKRGESFRFGDYTYTIRRASERAIIDIEVHR